ncbi:hypothetical protein ARALYDRAFT_359049 [Arabidopsis lyrata subsp. lyrata]|uniref:Arabidopsis retrotransposon Orf1 C-terminal domain-containing protein n=1 Tax=Arabidopsis lyrata subsp. lyrata TaxID=81972 RepID=D7MVF6_ARALL|nr:hypothetical protein ARALYDRAFT_359049 [Arabidopsis lyrata subsp. lyrata]
MAPKKRQRPGKVPMTEERSEPQDIQWTHGEKTSRSDFEKIKVHPTRFVDRFFLRQMGLAEGVDDLLQRIGMSCLKDMYYPTFEEETRDFLSTVKVEYEKPRDKVASQVTLKELCLLYQGLKHLLIDMRGVLLEYEFGDEINYGSIFANNLLQFKTWAKTTPNPDLYIGGMLTPLFKKAGVDLSSSRELPDMAYLSRDYLILSRFLKATRDLNTLHYKIQLRDKTKKIFVLPQPDKTNILTLTNVKFEVGEEDLLQEDQGPMELSDGDGEDAAEPRDYLEELNMIQMPDIEQHSETTRRCKTS